MSLRVWLADCSGNYNVTLLIAALQEQCREVHRFRLQEIPLFVSAEN